MTIFRNYTLKWWQIGLLKFALLFLGIAIGANWPLVFAPYTACLVITGLVIGIYVKIAAFR